jgi:hypothetical protein
VLCCCLSFRQVFSVAIASCMMHKSHAHL